MQSVIRVRNLYKLYHLGEETVRALDGVDFEIQKGEFCAIVGTSGSGKSTLLNMLAGLEKPTKGEVVISGCHLERMNEEQLVSFRRRRVGFIFQAYQLIASMDAEENVALPLSFRGMKKRERTLRARRMLDRVMLGKYRKHFPNQMSGGQQQRVGVARALVSDPEIIFADEPTGNLDSRTSREIMSLMQKVVREQGCTLVMVTHDPQLASWADRIIKVIDGKIVSIEVKKKESTEDEEMV
ncbi:MULTISPECIES: ABC transporter ATP-binding protein [Clostridia]|uniref:ABC transporter ATP-binding protein n=1 Tax=Faecalicatena fissicatena TaxID=290055 RepID=A0ABS2E5I8_9FIRM|nr:ABC transporter ATP-binding protein [Eubacterium sp. ER2]MBM6736888.1 ABC transporter ATP-binding protein [Faecalicatena fissicatena]